MGAIRKTDMRFKRRKPKPPVNFFPHRTEFRFREHAEFDRDAVLAYSRAIREAAAQQPARPIKTHDAEDWAKFLDRYGRPKRRAAAAHAVPPARTVNEQIAALLLDD